MDLVLVFYPSKFLDLHSFNASLNPSQRVMSYWF